MYTGVQESPLRSGPKIELKPRGVIEEDTKKDAAAVKKYDGVV